MSESVFQSWGKYPKVQQRVLSPAWRTEVEFPQDATSVLAYGKGRSYGDCCLNDGGSIISTRFLDHLISFDATTGILRCESGLSFYDLLQFAVPRGWFLPVTPGTQFVSVGGAIANDVHGKNHHRAGTFGCWVKRLELLRSDGSVSICSMDENRELFAATVGGLGLTGFIRWAEIQLKPVAGPYIDVQSIKFKSLEEFFEISRSSDVDFEYTVAWLDCVASGNDFGRGIFLRGNHSPALTEKKRRGARIRPTVPFDMPPFVLGKLSVKAFNALYYGKQREREKRFKSHYEPFFYPLDAVDNWNRIYGTRGFFQFQCVVPQDNDNAAIRNILKAIVASGRASFLAVIKEFGDIPSPGLLSFPRKGITLCLDFPNQGAVSMALMQQLDRMTCEYGGAMYPAKDATMAPKSFKQYYPKLELFSKSRDPRFSSSLWRRLTEQS